MFDLKQFDKEAKPSEATYASAKDLPDGDYDFEIVSAAFKTAKKKETKEEMTILEMDLLVLSPAAHHDKRVPRSSFLTSQKAFDVLLADLKRLGFDSDQWTVANNRPASDELDKAIKLMPGLRFSSKKETNGTFHNINIRERLGTDGKPQTFDAKALNEAPADPF